MKNLLIVLFLALCVCGCTNERKVARWIKNHGGLKSDTVRVTSVRLDTLYVPVPGDTVRMTSVLRDMDTIIVNGRAEVRVVVRTDTITKIRYITVNGICKPDTIRLIERDTFVSNVITNVEVRETKPFWKRLSGYAWTAFWWLLVFVIIYFGIRLWKYYSN